jgi:hypothetical protein
LSPCEATTSHGGAPGATEREITAFVRPPNAYVPRSKARTFAGPHAGRRKEPAYPGITGVVVNALLVVEIGTTATCSKLVA